MNIENPLIKFARDFSHNDKHVVEKAEYFVFHPPTDEKQIGFYGPEKSAPETRSFLAIVHLLDRFGYLQSVEDKYAIELLYKWKEEGLVEVNKLKPTAKAVFGSLIDLDFEEAKEELADAWKDYPKATEELEEHIASNGKILLSIDATEGDTMFFVLASPDLAERWRDKALNDENGYRSGVWSFMWDRYWDFVVESTSISHVDYPPGTRISNHTIPFMK